MNASGPKRWRIYARNAFIAISMTATLSMIGFVFYAAALLPETPELSDIWDQKGAPSITFLDRNGQILMKRGARYGSLVPLDELPKHLIDAFLAIEDRRFYQHYGIDLRGLSRAVWVNYQEGRLAQGGSTLTQQLAKNLFLTPERTFERKIQEMLLAMWLEANLSKNEILTLYLNRIYLGAGTYGVEAAAQYYFGKSARDVSIAEAALIAGLPQAPSRYAPTNNIEGAHRRANLVLNKMVEIGAATHGEVFAARVQPATLVETEASGSANYFVDWVTEELSELIGRPDVNVIVQTTFDPDLQLKAELALLSALEPKRLQLNADQTAIVTMDLDGGVRAMIGGTSYDDSQFNRAAQAKRQPGSAFKPFVYLAGLEEGMTPESVMEDAPLTVDKWQPQNASGSYRGFVTLTTAMEKSINTVAVRVSETVGRDKVIEVARRLGIESDLSPNPSIALGTSEVSLLELTSAYVPFASGGEMNKRYGILSVKIPDGITLYERPQVLKDRVMKREHAAEMTYMLYKVMQEGTGRAAQLSDRPAAGKTGTSQDFRDAWFVGYTPSLVTGVWVGNDDGEPMKRVGGGSLPAQFWKNFMDRAHYGTEVAELTGVERRTQTAALDNEARRYLRDLSEKLSNVGRKKSRRRPGWWPF